jgi:hypothetical protein
MSFTALRMPMFFCTRRPFTFTSSLRYSFITMSRVCGSIMIGPRGLSGYFQPLSASCALSGSILPFRVVTTCAIAAMPS